MPHREPTIRSRELGEGLRQAMQQAGLTGKQAAQMLDVTPSYVSMLLAGKRAASEVDIAAFLGACRVKGAERDRLLALCREQDTPGWFQPHGSRLPQQLVTLIDHENKAVTISEFEAAGVPGLLQTGEYARAVISRVVNVPPEEVNDRVAARLARQSLFSQERPPRFTFYLHEHALRLPVGGRGDGRAVAPPAPDVGPALPDLTGAAGHARRACGDDRGVPADGVRRVQTGGLPGK